MIIASTIFFSCESEEIDVETQDANNVVSQEDSLKEYTLEEILASGAVIIDSSGTNRDEKAGFLPNASRGTELLRKSHITPLGYNDTSIERLHTTDGKIPKGVYFNGDSTPGGRGDYYHLFTPAKITINDATMKLVSNTTGSYSILTSKITDNRTNSKSVTSTISYSEAIGRATNWNVTGTVSVATSLTASFGIGEVTGTVTVGISASGGGESSVTRTITSTDSYVCPAYKRTKIIIYRRAKTSKYSYSAGISISGKVSTNFESKVNGHYFWSSNASRFLDGKNKTQTGFITSTYYEYLVTTTTY